MRQETLARPTVGFVGLGPLGAPVATRLVHAGLRVQVYDFDEATVRYFLMETGGEVAVNPRMMAETSDLVIALLPRPEDMPAVATGRDGVIHGFGAGKIFVDMSASPPGQTRELAKALGRAGIAMLDAPLLGGLPELRAGKLALLVGGDDEVVEHCRPVLETIAPRLIRTGAVGTGHAAKALAGQLAALCFLATAEILVVGRRAGLQPSALLEALNASAGANHATQETTARHVLSREFSSGLGLDALLGDLDRTLEIAREAGLPAPLSAIGRELCATARLALGPGQDHTRLVRWLEQVTKVDLTG